MEIPDVMFLTDNGLSQIINGYRSEIRIASSDKMNNGGVEYHHSRIVEALKAENEKLQTKLDESDDTAIILADRNAELKSKLDKAIDALRFYGDELNYKENREWLRGRGEPEITPADVIEDEGQRARKTLEEM